MLEDLPPERLFLLPGQAPPVGPQPRRLFVIKVGNIVWAFISMEVVPYASSRLCSGLAASRI